MLTLKARGHRGRWFARIGDEDIPCVFKRWLAVRHYADPGADLNSPKWQGYFQAIKREKRVALTGGGPGEEGNWERAGYIGLFRVENVSLSATGLEFDLVERIANLK
jgi:hypothetical protein